MTPLLIRLILLLRRSNPTLIYGAQRSNYIGETIFPKIDNDWSKSRERHEMHYTVYGQLLGP
jgi:hypothetical protein